MNLVALLYKVAVLDWSLGRLDNKVVSRLLLALSILAALGCSDAMSPDDYSHAWRQSVADYKKIDKDPNDPAANPDGNSDGSIQSRSAAASYISQQIRDIATSIKDLKAPPQYARLQDETYIFYRGQADEYQGYAQALGTGNPDKIDAAGNGINNFVDEHVQTITGVIDKLGNDSSRFRPAWVGILKNH